VELTRGEPISQAGKPGQQTAEGGDVNNRRVAQGAAAQFPKTGQGDFYELRICIIGEVLGRFIFSIRFWAQLLLPSRDCCSEKRIAGVARALRGIQRGVIWLGTLGHGSTAVGCCVIEFLRIGPVQTWSPVLRTSFSVLQTLSVASACKFSQHAERVIPPGPLLPDVPPCFFIASLSRGFFHDPTGPLLISRTIFGGSEPEVAWRSTLSKGGRVVKGQTSQPFVI